MVAFSYLKFFKDQLSALPNVDTKDLTGRTVIVTGSNTGLGQEAARHFALMKPELLIIAVRNLDKGNKAKESILKSAPSANVEVWQLDLSSFRSVKDFAARAKRDLSRLDVLALNAGVAIDSWQTTTDGYESTLQVNVISTGLLAFLLLPFVEETAKKPAPSGSSALKPHITLTGSEVHFWTPFKEQTDPHPIQLLNEQSKFDKGDRYQVSKLLDLFLAREIAQRVSSNVVVNVVNPGLCYSELGREGSLSGRIGLTVLRTLLARTQEAGSRTIVWACVNDTPPGAYSSNCTVEEESDYSLSSEGKVAQGKVYADLKEIWLKEAPELGKVLA